jgi:large subunit ribosomal protein L25
VPVHFINESAAPGIRRGGVLNIVRHTVNISCPAEEIPEQLICDLTGLDINDSLHISSVALPEGVEPTITDRDFTVATIAAPAGVKEEIRAAAEAAAAAETAAEGEEGEGAAADAEEEKAEADKE